MPASPRPPPVHPIWNYFGADEPNYLYAPNGKKLLGELAALSPVPVYFRPHNLFTTGNGDGSLKWGSTNVYTERPMERRSTTSPSPTASSTRSSPRMCARWSRSASCPRRSHPPRALSPHLPKGDIFTGWTYPPKDEAKWSKLVAAYATHLRDRYGSQTATWLWEVWNEPDIGYWHGTPAEYDRLYDLTAAAIRQVLPQQASAAPRPPASATIPSRSAPVSRALRPRRQCRNRRTGAPLDFISYHPKGSPKFVDGHV
jgi:xylan 1,4-beta-xylosidase